MCVMGVAVGQLLFKLLRVLCSALCVLCVCGQRGGLWLEAREGTAAGALVCGRCFCGGGVGVRHTLWVGLRSVSVFPGFLVSKRLWSSGRIQDSHS